MRKCLWNRLFLIAGGLLVSAVSLKVFLASKRWDILLGIGFCLGFVIVVCANLYQLFAGRRVFSETFEINVPGEASTQIPCSNSFLHGNVLLFFRQSIPLYSGMVTLSDSEKVLASILLPRIEDSGGLFKSSLSKHFTKGPWHLLVPVAAQNVKGDVKLDLVLNHNIDDPKRRQAYGFSDTETVEMQFRSKKNSPMSSHLNTP